MKQILLFAPYKGIGDLIFHIPLLRYLNKKYRSKISIITSITSKANLILKDEKYINQIHLIDINRGNFFAKVINTIQRINKIIPDLTILTSGNSRFKIALFFSKSKKKIYFPRYFDQDLSIFLINQFKKKLFIKKLNKNYNLELDLKKKNKQIIFINIDSSDNHNNWQINKFITLINYLTLNKSLSIFINFSPKNKDNFKDIFKKYHKKNKIYFTYKYNFNKLIDIIANSLIVIGNESGPNCLAAALNIPNIISIYNPLTSYPSSKTINKKVIFFKNNVKAETVCNEIQNILKDFYKYKNSKT